MKKNKIKYIIVLILSMFLVYYFKDEITILFNDLYNNFSQNFIQENRYLLILKMDKSNINNSLFLQY